MAGRVRLTASALALLFGVAPLSGQQAGLDEEVAANIEARLAYGELVGLVVGIVDADGRRFVSFGVTERHGATRPDENSVFEIGSVTKVFTATLLAEMAADGEVALDSAIQSYLPEEVVAPTRGGKEMSLAHLASHTSGLPRLPANMPAADPASPYADYTHELMYDFLAGYALTRDPGSQYEYSNYGAGLLGALLARQAGQSYETLVVERISEPLGMDNTRITLSPEMRARLVSGHAAGAPVPKWEWDALAGAGALVSTASDMIRFIEANLGLFETELEPVLKKSQRPRAARGPAGDSVALGWHVRVSGSLRIVWHNGETGGFHSFVGFNPDRPRGVVVLANSNTDIDDIGIHLLDPTFSVRPPPMPIEPEILESFVGEYRLAPNFTISVTRRGGRIFIQATDQPRFEIFATSETDFFLKAVGARITFNRGDSGEVESLTLHQNGRNMPAERIE